MSLISSEDGYENAEVKKSFKEITARRSRLEKRPRGHPERAEACRGLAFSLWEHYNQFGEQDLLLEAIDLEREALDLCPSDHEDHALSCQNLAASSTLR